MIALAPLRTLTLREPSRPGRPAHVSAASGLVSAGDWIHVIADDENHLATFPSHGDAPGTLTRILAGTLPLAAEARKRNKPDLESLARLPAFAGHPDGALLAVGSCSKRHRCTGVLIGLDAQGRLDGRCDEFDLSAFHDAFNDRFGRLNIEGVLVLGDELVLLQRGNKGDRLNARIRLRLGATLEALVSKRRLGIESLVDVEPVDLGAIGDVPLCFSDGTALPDGRMVFTAIAEDTDDSYTDGACSGAAIGVLAADGTIEFLEPTDSLLKVEGVEALVDGDAVRALLVTDADDGEIPAQLLEARIPLR